MTDKGRRGREGAWSSCRARGRSSSVLLITKSGKKRGKKKEKMSFGTFFLTKGRERGKEGYTPSPMRKGKGDLQGPVCGIRERGEKEKKAVSAFLPTEKEERGEEGRLPLQSHLWRGGGGMALYL